MPNPDATITLDMDGRCTRCRRKGATPGGLCLGCVVKHLKEDPSMLRSATRKGDVKGRHAAEQAQPPLIPMSHDELDTAARDLAGKIAELEEMEADHRDRRKAMRDTRNALLATIGAVASTIRSQGR